MLDRPPVGEPYMYRGCLVTATLIQPDLLGYVDGQEMPHFYLDLRSVRFAAEKMIDAKIKEQEEKKDAKRRNGR